VRLLNRAYTPNDIAETLRMPASLAGDWSARGYYGTLSHNAKAIYQKYLGWYDANPANLSPLPPAEQARRTVDYMGGADAVIARARNDFKAGQYRWVASVMNQVVFAEPANRPARELGADALEQLGYQAEAATWRNAYLMGAMELPNGVTKVPGIGAFSLDMLKAVPIGVIFDLWGVRLNPEKAEGKTMVINWTFTDVGERFIINLENSTLTHLRGKLAAKVDAGFTLTRVTLDSILVRQTTFPNAIKAGDIKVEGEPGKFGELIGMLDEIAPDFPSRAGAGETVRRRRGDVVRHITCSAIAALFAVYFLPSPGRTCAFDGVFDGSFGVPHPRSMEVAVAVRRAVEEGTLPPSAIEPIVPSAQGLWRAIARLHVLERRLSAVAAGVSLQSLQWWYCLRTPACGRGSPACPAAIRVKYTYQRPGLEKSPSFPTRQSSQESSMVACPPATPSIRD
jgi:hypothetical protein